jgi:hypothetical protein
LCNRIIGALTIWLDAIFRRFGSPATNENPDDDLSLEICAFSAHFARLASRDDALLVVASSPQTTSKKPVLQQSS